MKKEKIKQLVDVMQAYLNGKTIQYYKVDLSFKIEHPGEPNFNDKWVDVDEGHHFRPDWCDYRIKPEPEYRPFKDADECWQEMLKHQPFGWLKHKDDDEPYCILKITDSRISMIDVCEEVAFYDYNETFKQYIFADGAPFGVKEVVWEN